MKQPLNDRRKKTLLSGLLITLLLIAGNLVLTLQAPAHTLALGLQATTPPPTSILDFERTQIAAIEQTGAVITLTPLPTGTLWSFPAYIGTSAPGPALPSTPAGDGDIYDFGRQDTGKLMGINIVNEWLGEVSGRTFDVYAGSDYGDTTNAQGMVYVIVYDEYDSPQGPFLVKLPDGGHYPTPKQDGPVRIVGAQGARLTLLAADGQTFYFDVPGQQFTASLTDVVPTATPWPVTRIPTPIPTPTGDAPHNSYTVDVYSPVYTVMPFILYHAGDEDWFRFHSSIPGTIQVHLDNLFVDYDLYVYSVTRPRYRGHDGQSTNPGTKSELVTIQNAPPDDYMVRVVGVNGAFDPAHPYTLEIDIPVTADDLRGKISACVTDHDLGNSLNAKIDHQDWNPFINEVEAQTGKAITTECAHAMIGMATYLLNNPPPTATPKR